MNIMISKLQKFFHTDKWWGRAILIFSTYAVYWCIFYGILLLKTKNWDYANYDIYSVQLSVVIFLTCIVVPILSFFVLPKFFRRIFFIKHAYLVNSIFIIFSLLLFLFFELLISMKHWFNFL